MAHIDENFPLPVLLNPLLSEENRNRQIRDENGNRILGRDAGTLPPRQLVLEPRLAEDLVRRAEEAAIVPPPLELQTAGPPPAGSPPAGSPPPEPTGVEALNRNPAPLRPDTLATDPALRANRALRNILQEVEPVLEVNPNAEVNPNPETEAPGPVNLLLENLQPAPLFEVQTPTVNAAVENEPGDENLQEILRPEEELQAPPPPRDREAVITERGQNVDRLI